MRKFAGFLVLAALAAGCGDGSGDKAEAEAAKPSTSPSPSTPSPVPTVDKAVVQAKAKAALMAPEAVAGIDNLKVTEGKDRPVAYDNFCGRGVTADRAGVGATSQRVWIGRDTRVFQIVHANAEAAGTAVVEQIRTNMAGCDTYRDTCASYCAHIAVLGPLDVGTPPGIESTVGGCEKWTPIGDDEFFRCVVFLARGTSVTFLQVNGWTQKAATDVMKRIVPIAAAVLART